MPAPRPETMAERLPFADADIERIEQGRVEYLREQAEQTRREECPGCERDWPVRRVELIGRSGIWQLMHKGPRPIDGACWCQRPDLHPANRQTMEAEAHAARAEEVEG